MIKYRLFASIVLSFFLIFVSTSRVFADARFAEDERSAIQRSSAAWAQALNEHNPAKAASLYENHISLYATFKIQINNYKDLMQYFTRLTEKKDFHVKFNEEDIRVYGPTAVNSGLYTFTYKQAEKTFEVPARFTFVYVLTPDGWRIVEHHSSVLPE